MKIEATKQRSQPIPHAEQCSALLGSKWGMGSAKIAGRPRVAQVVPPGPGSNIFWDNHFAQRTRRQTKADGMSEKIGKSRIVSLLNRKCVCKWLIFRRLTPVLTFLDHFSVVIGLISRGLGKKHGLFELRIVSREAAKGAKAGGKIRRNKSEKVGLCRILRRHEGRCARPDGRRGRRPLHARRVRSPLKCRKIQRKWLISRVSNAECGV